MNNPEIIANIHTLVSHNVIGEHQLMSRYKGFRGEFLYEDYHTATFKSLKLYHGGTIVSIDSRLSSLDNAIYYNVISTEEFTAFTVDYHTIFRQLAKLGFLHLFLITYPTDTLAYEHKTVMQYPSGNIKLPVPALSIFVFDVKNFCFKATNNSVAQITKNLTYHKIRRKSKFPIPSKCLQWLQNNLGSFTKKQLLQLYADRLFLDGFIGFGADKGKISDIDAITKKRGSFRLIEIKEKDVAKVVHGFGLDVPRINDLKRITDTTALPYFVVIRQINNQRERKLVAWKYIDISDFIAGVKNSDAIEGGTGMRSAGSKNPTLICPYTLFSDL